MATLGVVAVWLSFAAALVSIGALVVGHGRGPRKGESLTNVGYLATFFAAGALTLAVLVLVFAFFRSDFTFMYVAENHSLDTSNLSWLYKLSGLWAGREGSFLLWSWMLSLYASFVAWKRLEITDPLSNMGVMVTNSVLAFFSAAMLFSDSNAPFKLSALDGSKLANDPNYYGPIIDSSGKLLTSHHMNVLLQHWAMILHPPMLFVGYAGLTIPFAFAVAALIVKDSSRAWVDIVDRITIFSWLFLGAGIGLGAVWAYVVLGWGGYWGWDPVENASLLPWLTGVALLHSFTVFKRRDGFKRWAIFLSGATFALVILGTFITRSGIVQSVHAFAPDTVSLYIFGVMIAAGLFVPLGLLLWRWQAFEGNDEFESLTSKEAAYYFNNVIMLVAGFLVAYLTVTPALPTFLPMGHGTVPASTYDAIARPVGIAYLAILAFCPMLSWRKTEWSALGKRFGVPLLVAAFIFTALLFEWGLVLRPIYDLMIMLPTVAGQKLASSGPAWYYHGLAIVGFLVSSVLIANMLWLFIDGALKRAEARGESFLAALWSILTKARTQSGGYVAHIGMGIILIGLIGSAMFVQDQTFVLNNTPGAQVQMAGYTLTYQGIAMPPQANGDAKQVISLQVSRGSKVLETVHPAFTMMTNKQTKEDAAVISQPLHDLFIVFQGAQENTLALNVKLNPLIWFTWGGFILLLFGTAVAVWPKRGAGDLAVTRRRKAA